MQSNNINNKIYSCVLYIRLFTLLQRKDKVREKKQENRLQFIDRF